ncbi:MAG: diacylglycerol/lipid kinase family protein [Phycisphaerales bacterium]
MSVLILFNPHSGRNRAEACARELETAFASRSMPANVCSTADVPNLASSLNGRAALVIIGGDGTVNRALASCVAARVPIYHFPCGNQNLFARACGHTRDVSAAVGMVAAGKTRSLDVGAVAKVNQIDQSRRFALMVSFGPDASVIDRLCSRPRTAKGHWAYLRPVLAEALEAAIHPRPAPLRVWVDGKKIADDAGWLVVAANTPYALGLDPCAQGELSPQGDGLLDIAFFPLRFRFGILKWMARCSTRTAAQHPAAVRCRGKAVVVEGAGPWQFDGDVGGRLEARERLRLECLDSPITYFVQ